MFQDPFVLSKEKKQDSRLAVSGSYFIRMDELSEWSHGGNGVNDALPWEQVSSALYHTCEWYAVGRRAYDGSYAGCCWSSPHPGGTHSPSHPQKHSQRVIKQTKDTLGVKLQKCCRVWRQLRLRLGSEWGNACRSHPSGQRAHNLVFLDSSSPRNLRHTAAAAEPPASEQLRGTSPAAPEDDLPPVAGTQRTREKGNGWQEFEENEWRCLAKEAVMFGSAKQIFGSVCYLCQVRKGERYCFVFF